MARTRQPQSGLRINRNSPFADRLLFLNSASSPQELVTGSLPVYNIGTKPLPTSRGIAIANAAAGNTGGEGWTTNATALPLTIFALTRYTAATNRIFGLFGNPRSGYMFESTASLFRLMAMNGSVYNTETLRSMTPVEGNIYALMGVIASDTDRKIYVNGVAGTTGTTSVALGGWPLFEAGPMYRDGTVRYEGNIGGLLAAAAWSRAFSADEARRFVTDPDIWSLFAPSRSVWVQLGASGGAGTTTTIEPSKGSIAVSGYAPGVARTASQTASPSVGHLTATGYAPGVSQSVVITVAPTVGHVTVTGKQPGVARTGNQAVAPSKGASLLSGYAPGIEQDIAVAPSVGHLVVTGKQPGVTQNVTTFIAPDKGALTVTGKQPGISTTSNQVIAPASGALLLGGYVPVIGQTGSLTIAPSNGALTLTGYAPTVQVIGTGVTTVEPLVGAMALAGHAPLVRVAVTPSAGGYRFRSRSGEQRRPQQENARRPR